MTTTLSLLMILACGGEPPPSGKDMVVTGGSGGEKAVDATGKEQPTAHVENTGDLDRFAFTCCGTPAATVMIRAYVSLQEALAADNAADSAKAMQALVTAADATALDQGLSEAARAQAAGIAAGSKALLGKDMATVRATLASLSVEVIHFARDNQGGDTKVVSAWCPMAPGHWLQTTAEIRNPYYGAEMLTCGTLEAVTDVE